MNDDKFEKGINLIISETKQNLLNELSGSGLPISICQMILNELKFSFDKVAIEQIEKERIEYENFLNSKNSKEEVKK